MSSSTVEAIRTLVRELNPTANVLTTKVASTADKVVQPRLSTRGQTRCLRSQIGGSYATIHKGLIGRRDLDRRLRRQFFLSLQTSPADSSGATVDSHCGCSQSTAAPG